MIKDFLKYRTTHLVLFIATLLIGFQFLVGPSSPEKTSLVAELEKAFDLYRTYPYMGLGIFSLVMLIAVYLFEIRPNKIQDIDRRSRDMGYGMEIDRPTPPTGNDNSGVDRSSNTEAAGVNFKEDKSWDFEKDSFNRYFFQMINILVKKADEADEKASALLDRGLSYSFGGIVFYVFTIFIWQVFGQSGFKEHHYIGVASCTCVFIFIQFLGAWSLKQYRSYIDTSAYLLRVKTIIDRYYLAYLAITQDQHNNIQKTALIEMLDKDIKWPDTYLLKNKEVGFAREAMETMTMMAQSMRKEAQNVTQNSKTETK